MPPVDEAKEEAERHRQAVLFRSAVERGELEEAEEMLQNGANACFRMNDGSHWNVLMLAANGGHSNLVEKFCKGPRMPKVDEQDPHGFQAIQLAALKGHLEICRTLLDRKASVDATTVDGETPLMVAAANGHDTMVKCLLNAKADPLAVDKNGMSAVKKAARWGKIECVRTLVAIPRLRDDAQLLKHCLLFGKLYQHEEVVAEVKMLMDNKEDVK